MTGTCWLGLAGKVTKVLATSLSTLMLFYAYFEWGFFSSLFMAVVVFLVFAGVSACLSGIDWNELQRKLEEEELQQQEQAEAEAAGQEGIPDAGSMNALSLKDD
eukprot:TRINITY_DN37195_c0_g1_i1.p2 TRINITY_DN37195_c0_g1~~TRINITY_DN37195_c0_g1_i1.p2  ORF type:complete len:104 (+),score=25.89 TRINITY_DN37195_c0_g1_i1:184-495(+)